MPPGDRWSTRALWATLAWVVVILAVSLSPDHSRPTQPFRACIVCGIDGAAAGLLLNVVLYMPLGAGLRVATGRVLVAAASGLGLSIAVEVAQLGIPGRFSTLEDLVANGAGAAVGAVLTLAPLAWIAPRGPRGRVVSGAVVATALAALAGPVLLFERTAPRDDLFSLWTPTVAGLETYEGRVLEARIGDVVLSDAPVREAGIARRALLEDGDVRLAFEVGPPPDGMAPVLRLVAVEGKWEETFTVGVDDRDLVVRFRYRASDLRLSRPSLRLRDALAGFEVGDTVALSITRAPSGGDLVALEDGPRAELGPTLARGWTVWLGPGGSSELVRGLLDVVWLGALAAALGWWAPRSVPVLLVAAVPLALLLVLPLAPTLMATPLGHYAVVALAVVLGRAGRGALEARLSGAAGARGAPFPEAAR